MTTEAAAILGLIGILISAISGLIGSWIGSHFNEQRHRREIGVKMIEIALGVLSRKPDEKQQLRAWAIKVLDKYANEAGVPLSPEDKGALRDNPLPITTIFDAATGRDMSGPIGMPETLREAARKATE
jgi:hypothetical protein